MKHIKFYIACFAVLSFHTSNAQTIPLDTALHTGKLANGFTWYIRHNSEPADRVYLYLVNNVGSVLEDDDQQGLAHFMEHMNFNGTKHFPKNELVDYLQKSGVRFGADLNAYTSFDETVFQLPLPADDPSILKNGFRIMRDWAQDATLDSTEIAKERGVVLEEKRLGKGAQERMQRKYWPMLLNDSRYAHRLPIGKENILVNFPPSVLRRFHHDWYRPDLQALIVVGDIDVNATEKLVKSMFGDLVNPVPERTRDDYKVPLTGQNRFMAVTDKEMPVTSLSVVVMHKAEDLETEQNYLHSMERQLFNRMMDQRFTELAQQPDPPFINAGAGIGGFLDDLDMFSFNLTAKESRLKEGFEKAWAEVERVQRFGFTEAELNRARLNYLSNMETSRKEKDKTPSENLVREYQELFLHDEASPGIEWEYQFVKNHIGVITLADINEVVKEYIKNEGRDILILAPDKGKDNLPDSATVTGWVQDVDSEPLTAWKDEISDNALLEDQPVSGKVVAKKQLASLGITELSLSNGVHIILKPTSFKNDEILFTGFSEGGSSLYSKKDFQSASNAGIVSSFGVGTFSPVELNNLLTGKQVQVSPYISERSEGINGATASGDLETALQLVYLHITRPRKDSVLFKNIIDRSEQVLGSRYSDPNNVFKDTINFVMGNYDFRRSAPSVEKLLEINLEKAYTIYRERFADASGFTFIFVGSFNADSITPLLTRYLGSLPSLHKNEKAIDHGIHIPSGKMVKKVFKGSENKATVVMVFSGNYAFTPENNMLLQAMKEILEIKVLEHLREDESEVYAPSVQVSYQKFPHSSFHFTVAFGCAPKNADHLMSGVEKEISALRQKGPVKEDVEKFKAEYARTHETQLRDNDYWLSYLDNQAENKEDMDQILHYTQRLDKVTVTAVQQAAQRYFSGKNEIRFELLPENK